MARGAAARALLVVGALALLGPWETRGEDAGGSPDVRPEWFRSPISGRVYTAERDSESGRKQLRDQDGAFWDSPRAILDHEAAALPPLERIVHRELLAALRDPARAGDPADLILILQEQPTTDAAAAARDRFAPVVEPLLSEMRGILSRIAPLRDPRPELSLRERIEEEGRLLTERERARLVELRDLVREQKARMRREILEEARPQTLASQERLVAYLESVPGATLHGRYVAMNAVAARVPLGWVERMVADLPEVASVHPSRRAEVQLDTSVPTVSGSTWWNAGYDGSSSTKVAVLDTGVDSGHPALSGYVSNSAVYLTTASSKSDFNDSTTSTDDKQGHGTHVAGIVGSTDSTYTGVAYGGRVMNAKVGYLTTSGGAVFWDSDVMSGGDWAATNGADAMNLSFGWSSVINDGSFTLSLFFDAVHFNLNVPIAVAAGNQSSAPSGSVHSPADGYNVITVGNLDDYDTTSHGDNSLNSSSCRGPTYDGRQKPDLSAPGTSIRSCAYDWEGSNSDFVNKTGTSMAAPHVAGALALLDDYGASWNSEGYKALLLTTPRHSSPYPTTPGDSWGYGAMDLAAAYTSRATVHEGTLDSSGARYVLLSASALSAGDRATLCWSRHVLSNKASTPTTYHSLIDVDLYLFDGATGSQIDSSVDLLNPVEQVTASSAVASPVLKVYRYGSFPTGQTKLYWSLATEGTGATTAATPPTLACSFKTPAPAAVAGSEAFPVAVEVKNSGGLGAFSPEVTLTLPAGYAVVSGANPRTVADLAAGATATATWTVRSSGGPSGTRTFTAAAETYSFRETFTSADVSSSHTLDVDAPTGTLLLANGAAYTGSRTVAVALTATDALTGVPLERLRDGGGAWGEWQAHPTAVEWTLPAGDGTKTVEIQYRDGVGNVSAAASDTIVLDTTPPAGSLSGSAWTEYVASAAVTLLPSATDAGAGVAEMRFSDDGTTWSDWEPYAASRAWTLPGADGLKTVFAQYRDHVGNVSGTSTWSIGLDRTPPTGTVALDTALDYTRDPEITLRTSATDAHSGIAFMRFGTNGSSWSSWVPYATTATWTLVGSDGAKTIHAEFRDLAGNVAAAPPLTIVLDRLPPEGSVTIASGDGYTRTTSVTLDLSYTDSATGVDALRLRNGAGAWGDWTDPTDSVAWTLPAGDAVKTVGLQLRDVAGNVSAEITDQITYDVTPPTGEVSILGGLAAINRFAVSLDLLHEDNLAGVDALRLRNAGEEWSVWSAAAADLPWTLPEGEGLRVVEVEFRDAAGNVSALATDAILVDTTPPTGAFLVNGDREYLMPWADLVADTDATDPGEGSGVRDFRYSYDAGATWSAWEPLADGPAVPLVRPAEEHLVEVVGEFRDAAGNVSPTSLDRVHLVEAAPQRINLDAQLAGTTAAGGDVDAYRLDLVAGSVLSVDVAARPVVKKTDFALEIDVHGPDGAQLVAGRFPDTERRLRVKKLAAPRTGTYWIVLRPVGEAREAGGTYALKTRFTIPRAAAAPKGTAVPLGEPSQGTIRLEATAGSAITGRFAGRLPGTAELRSASGSVRPLTLAGKSGGRAWKLPRLLVPAGTDTYELVVDADEEFGYRLRIKPPRRTRGGVETE